MKNLRWLTTLAVLLLCAAASFADGIPDGKVGVVGGSDPTIIPTTTFNFMFTPCSGPGAPPECGAFGPNSGVQAVFAGINESGVAWDALTLIINFATPTTSADLFVSCDGGSLFSITGDGCNQNIPVGTTSLTLQFLEGTGSGIGCYDNTGALYDTTCLTNSIANEQANLLNPNLNQQNALPYDNPVDGSCPPGQAPGEVCGPNSFVLGVSLWTDVPTGGTLIANPEPPSYLLVGGAMLAMLVLALKKARLVQV